MEIINDLRRCISEYKISTGVTPTRLYLGHSTIQRLEAFAHVSQGYVTRPVYGDDGKSRPHALGLPIYVVDDAGEHMRACA